MRASRWLMRDDYLLAARRDSVGLQLGLMRAASATMHASRISEHHASRRIHHASWRVQPDA
jgi:hypothetical protein